MTTKAPTAQNGFAVRDFRIKAKLTPDELAQRVGISTPHLRNIENEHKSASDVDLEKIAEVCDVRVQSLRRTSRAQAPAAAPRGPAVDGAVCVTDAAAAGPMAPGMTRTFSPSALDAAPLPTRAQAIAAAGEVLARSLARQAERTPHDAALAALGTTATPERIAAWLRVHRPQHTRRTA